MISPRPIRYDQIDLSWIVGRSITDISFLEPAQWRFFLGSSEHIAVECLWRIVSRERVVRARDDHHQKFGHPGPVDAAKEASALLSSRPIVAVDLKEATADIHIRFAENLRLEIITNSGGYESWQLYGPAGICFVAQGGGQICTWSQ